MPEERRGFAGFESLVTDLSDLPPPPPPSVSNHKSAPPPAARPEHQGDGDWPRPPPKTSFPTWIVPVTFLSVVLGAFVIGSFANIAGNARRISAAPTYPTTYRPSAPFIPSEYSRFQPTVQPEEKPPVGEDLVLSTAQLRYCLAQGARIDGGEKVADKTSQIEIERFNALIDDYNARCLKYRYRASAMQTAKADVDARRAQLEREGADLLRSLSSR